MKISMLQFKRMLKETVSEEITHRNLVDGFSKHIRHTVNMCADQIMSKMADIASEFENDQEYGEYVFEFDFRDNENLHKKLVVGMNKLIDGLADELIENAMSAKETESSSAETFQTNVFNKTYAAKQKYRASRKYDA